jgi:tetratricopeptide (TPR) repeat protein
MRERDLSEKINSLIRQQSWDRARALLNKELEKSPKSHWLLTQLGVTWYEQRKYKQAMKFFLASARIVPDCPLTLWNLAGALDALGHPGGALRVYTLLLQSTTSHEDDSCWESQEWTDALKADCVYRVGTCLEKIGKNQKAKHCYQQYLNLLMTGIGGTYSEEAVMDRIRGLQGSGKRSAANDAKKAFSAALDALGLLRKTGRSATPPRINLERLAASSLQAGKHPLSGR